MNPSAPAPFPADASLRRERLTILAALAALTLLSWLYLVVLANAMDTMGSDAISPYMWLMPIGRWGFVEFALCLAMWIVMMVAMMVPSAAPMLLAFHAVVRSRSEGASARLSFAAFLAGYLVLWSLFSVVAAGAQWWLHETAFVTDMMYSASRPLDAVLLLAAGIYQFTPAKHRCLSRCRTPFGFILTEWRDGARGALIMGMRHGAYCVGCCWAMMALLFVGGVMNLLWIALITAAVLLEKAVPFGATIGKLAGVGLCVAAGRLLLVG